MQRPMPEPMTRRVAPILSIAACLAAAAPAAASPGGKQAAAAKPAAKAGPRPPAAPSDQLDEMGYHGDEGYARVRGKKDTCDGDTDGRELVGAALPEWSLSDWANAKGAPPTLASLRGRVVVVRFWTAGCGFCEKTLPALQRLSAELGDRPLTVVGAFHGKPDSSAPDIEKPLAIARSWRVTFPIALDRQWKTLRRWWLDGHHRHATSVTFVIGKDGRVAHIHPGPVFYPTDNPAEKGMDEDYQAVKKAVLAALAAP